MPLLRALPEISQFSISYVVISISDEARRMPFIRDSRINLFGINLEHSPSRNVKRPISQPAGWSAVTGSAIDVVR